MPCHWCCTKSNYWHYLGGRKGLFSAESYADRLSSYWRFSYSNHNNWSLLTLTISVCQFLQDWLEKLLIFSYQDRSSIATCITIYLYILSTRLHVSVCSSSSWWDGGPPEGATLVHDTNTFAACVINTCSTFWKFQQELSQCETRDKNLIKASFKGT